VKTVFTDRQLLQDGSSELIDGKLVKAFECKERAEMVLDRVRTQGIGPVVEPTEHGLAPRARRVLNSVFLDLALMEGLDAAILNAGRVLPLWLSASPLRDAAGNVTGFVFLLTEFHIQTAFFCSGHAVREHMPLSQQNTYLYSIFHL
jgi:hypothetical protein